jgi:hypothetical protein
MTDGNYDDGMKSVNDLLISTDGEQIVYTNN